MIRWVYYLFTWWCAFTLAQGYSYNVIIQFHWPVKCILIIRSVHSVHKESAYSSPKMRTKHSQEHSRVSHAAYKWYLSQRITRLRSKTQGVDFFLITVTCTWTSYNRSKTILVILTVTFYMMFYTCLTVKSYIHILFRWLTYEHKQSSKLKSQFIEFRPWTVVE